MDNIVQSNGQLLKQVQARLSFLRNQKNQLDDACDTLFDLYHGFCVEEKVTRENAQVPVLSCSETPATGARAAQKKPSNKGDSSSKNDLMKKKYLHRVPHEAGSEVCFTAPGYHCGRQRRAFTFNDDIVGDVPYPYTQVLNSRKNDDDDDDDDDEYERSEENQETVMTATTSFAGASDIVPLAYRKRGYDEVGGSLFKDAMMVAANQSSQQLERYDNTSLVSSSSSSSPRVRKMGNYHLIPPPLMVHCPPPLNKDEVHIQKIFTRFPCYFPGCLGRDALSNNNNSGRGKLPVADNGSEGNGNSPSSSDGWTKVLDQRLAELVTQAILLSPSPLQGKASSLLGTEDAMELVASILSASDPENDKKETPNESKKKDSPSAAPFMALIRTIEANDKPALVQPKALLRAAQLLYRAIGSIPSEMWCIIAEKLQLAVQVDCAPSKREKRKQKGGKHYAQENYKNRRCNAGLPEGLESLSSFSGPTCALRCLNTILPEAIGESLPRQPFSQNETEVEITKELMLEYASTHNLPTPLNDETKAAILSCEEDDEENSSLLGKLTPSRHFWFFERHLSLMNASHSPESLRLFVGSSPFSLLQFLQRGKTLEDLQQDASRSSCK